MNKFIHDRLPLFTFVIIIFVLGISFGAIAVKTVDYSIKENVFTYFNNFMQGYEKIEYNQASIVGESIKFNLLSIIIIWAFGLSMILMPLLTVLIFFKGFVLGFTVGFLVSEYSFKGILIALAAIFPQNIIIIPIYILSCVMAISLSIKIFEYYRGREKVSSEDLMLYSVEIGILAFVMLLASLVETYISPFLLKVLLRFI
ncbi:MAG: stage II sporulation protein M [Halanaerobiales bacterium]